MSKHAKTLCEYKKSEIKKDLDELKEIVKDPQFICKKCARASSIEESLCKPEKL